MCVCVHAHTWHETCVKFSSDLHMCTKIHVHVGIGELTVTNICTPTQINKNNIKLILYPHCIILKVENWSNLNIYLWEKEFIVVICYIAISEILKEKNYESPWITWWTPCHISIRGVVWGGHVLGFFPWKFELLLEVKNSFDFIYMHMILLPACMSVCRVHAWWPQQLEKDTRFLEIGVTDNHMGGRKRTASAHNYLSHLSSPLEAKIFWMFFNWLS